MFESKRLILKFFRSNISQLIYNYSSAILDSYSLANLSRYNIRIYHLHNFNFPPRFLLFIFKNNRGRIFKRRHIDQPISNNKYKQRYQENQRARHASPSCLPLSVSLSLQRNSKDNSLPAKEEEEEEKEKKEGGRRNKKLAGSYLTATERCGPFYPPFYVISNRTKSLARIVVQGSRIQPRDVSIKFPGTIASHDRLGHVDCEMPLGHASSRVRCLLLEQIALTRWRTRSLRQLIRGK